MNSFLGRTTRLPVTQPALYKAGGVPWDGETTMTRMVRDYVQVGDFTSLDHLIEQLTAIRDSLPGEAAPEIRLRGDEYYGRHIAVGYNRPLTAEEEACEGRYAEGDAWLKVAA